MSKIVQYKTYTIKSLPSAQSNHASWQPEVMITWDRRQAVMTRHFAPKIICPTEEEADVQGITYAQQVIDGQVPGVPIE